VIKIPFMEKLRADRNQGMLPIIWCRIFCLSVCYQSVKIKIYSTVIFAVVLYGCESWSLTLRVECRLRVFENGRLRRIFGPQRDEVTGEWRRLHNKEFYALYSSPNIIQVIKSRRLRWVGHVARIGARREVHSGLQWGKPRKGDYLKDPGGDGRIILKWIFVRLDGGA
jgi:hypothetical protein